MHHDAAALLPRQVRGQSEKLLFRSFDFVRMTHDRRAAAVYSARNYRVLL